MSENVEDKIDQIIENDDRYISLLANGLEAINLDEETHKILAKLVEGGPELDPVHKKILRNKIQDRLEFYTKRFEK